MLEHETGLPRSELPRHAVEVVLGGANLKDLALTGRIDTDVESLLVVNPDSVGKPVLGCAPAQIKAENVP